MMSKRLAAEQKRQQIITAVRQFFAAQNFSEVTTPFLSSGVPLEPTIFPFTTIWTGVEPPRELFLSISPEREMKILLAQGADKIFTIGHCFRNLEGAGTNHHPEFLMLEWYRADCNYQQIIADTQALITFVAEKIVSPQAPFIWQTLSVEDLWQQKFSLSLSQVLTRAALGKLARRLGYDDHGDWEQLFNQLFLNELESAFPQTPFILLDFPACLSPLCALKPGQPWLAERFEVYLGGLEIGNGNSEGLDAGRIRRLFQAQARLRRQRGQVASPLDEEFLAAIAALKKSGRLYAGMGLGIDRLTLALTDVASMAELYLAKA